MSKQIINVAGMSCQHCVSAVQKGLLDLPGISEVQVDLSSGKVSFNMDDSKMNMDKIAEAIEDMGYDFVK